MNLKHRQIEMETQKCNLCGLNAAKHECDRCENRNLCDNCYIPKYNTSIYEGDMICRDCIMLSRDCQFCADEWLNGESDDAKLAIVCAKCRHGYCENCTHLINGMYSCPMCYDSVEPAKSSVPVIRKKRVDNVTAFSDIPDFHDFLDQKDADKNEYTKIDGSRIVKAQINNRLRTKFGIEDPGTFCKALFDTGSVISGSFNLEIMLGEMYDDGDLDIYCSGTGYTRLKKLIPADYRLTVSQDKKYAHMRGGQFIKNVDTYETSLRRIQFIVMRDMANLDQHIDTFDLTAVQNKFDGRDFHVRHLETLEKRATVLEFSADRVRKYYDRGFKLQITLTDELVEKILG